MKRISIKTCRGGFTLIEVLVALLVVGLCVTVFFQLLSAGIKLELKTRRLGALQRDICQWLPLFDDLDVRHEDFPWQGEAAGMDWELKLYPVETSPDAAAEDNEIPLKLTHELYRYVLDLHYGFRRRKHLQLVFFRYYKRGYFSDDFKDCHLQAIADETSGQ